MADDKDIRLQQLADQVAAHEDRLQAVEVWRATTEAVRRERDKHMDDRFDRVEKGVREVIGYLTRLAWIIVAGIIAAVMSFIFAGGLTYVPAIQ